MNDLNFALRQLMKTPGFTTVAMLTLALGVGANTALFNVFNALVLKPLDEFNHLAFEFLAKVYPK